MPTDDHDDHAHEENEGPVLTQREGTIAPDDLDEATKPRRVDDIVQVEVAGEQVIIGGAWGGAQVLNPTGALVWQFLDGEASLGELVDDFADAMEAPRDVVHDDVLRFVRSLGYAGLLVDVEPPYVELDLAGATPQTTFEDGQEFEPFAAPDLDGVEHTLVDSRGRPVYLVNWNPGCGYCDAIAETLAALEDDLAAAGAALVLVAAGGEEANRALVERSGLRAPVLLKPEGVDPFGGLGTPAAVQLDEEGRVVGDLAMGAFEVPERAAQLAGVELPTVNADEDAEGARYLPAAGGMCGAGATSGPKTSWAGTSAFAFGDVRVGIRYSNESTADLLEKLLVGAKVDDAGVPDNYSVALTDPDSRSKELELLVLGTLQVVRSRSKRRVLSGLLRYLAHDLVPPDPTLLRLQATGAVDRDGHGLLLPAGLTGWIGKLQPRLARLGIALVDAPDASVDPTTGELVVEQPAIEHDPTVLDDVDAGLTLGRTELPLVESGRYPLAGWFVYAAEADELSEEPLRPALAVASTVALCSGDDVADKVTGLTRLLDRVPVRAIHYSSANELSAALERR